MKQIIGTLLGVCCGFGLALAFVRWVDDQWVPPQYRTINYWGWRR